jgi:threonine dehydratase
MRVPVFSDIVAARAVVDRHLTKTPLVKSRSLSRLIGCDYEADC